MMADMADMELFRERINARLAVIYPEGPALLTEPLAYIATGRGKRLRPILTLLSARACGGETEAALPAAVAVEVLHNFTLVHDDIMDGDETRHGQPAVHARWNRSVAILAGDVLFVLALQELRRSPTHVAELIDAFAAGALAVCEGQALDLAFEEQDAVSVSEYLNMVDLKTGYMLGLAAELGALTAGAETAQVASLRQFGRSLGRAFQIQDDLLEIYSDSDTMGKSLGSDLAAGKKTYLLIAAIQKNPDATRAALKTAGHDLPAGLVQLRDILDANGVKTEAEALIEKTVSAGLAALEPLGDQGTELTAYAGMILNRKK